MTQPLPAPPLRPDAVPAVRKQQITRDELVQAAQSLLGPSRSVSTLSLREVARAAGIAPNSFYRHFRDIDELSVALVEQAGTSLRRLFSEARSRANASASVVRSSLEVFFEQLNDPRGDLALLICEGRVGSDSLKQAVERELEYFEVELKSDLERLERLHDGRLHESGLAARAITRLVFSMGSLAAGEPPARQEMVVAQLQVMIRMIIAGSRQMAGAGQAAP